MNITNLSPTIGPPGTLVTISLSAGALMIAEKKVQYAVDAWRACQQDGAWPGYPARTCYAVMPSWHESWWLERELR